ncbi:phosphoribosylglycinamide formyltransferase [Blattabacterium sp. (Cryptocercus kyebangensis)]|uniref:formyltransferase family protein n=1 Tax=Blattabacterium sp. (Cryptocercus kyebangensis) TaxID=298656 RepID=UPI000D7C58D8|nr:formyltransferase family protein [Blattabacterium sp. (Cryptocercus kyebangensis)]AWU43865.1 phosphoribosylglycinamide formyltransferase [Blattabacterium sp. (Cryptocercus kyebangensis)]
MKKLAILVSGIGTNMQHILQSISNGKLSQVKIDSVVSDRYCRAIQYALKENIPSFSLEKTKKKLLSKEIDKIFIKYIPDIIVLSGFLSILDSEFCDKWAGKIINIHPSLLPKYGGKGMYGMKVHQRVINNKEKISGATVHYVTKNIDSGNIILKKSCKISSNETPISLSKKISIIEKELLIQSLNNI